MPVQVAQSTEIVGNIKIPARVGQMPQDITLVKDRAAYDAAGIKYSNWISSSEMHVSDGARPGSFHIKIKSKKEIHAGSQPSFIIKANNMYYMVGGKYGSLQAVTDHYPRRGQSLTGNLYEQRNKTAKLENELAISQAVIDQGRKELQAIKKEKLARIRKLERVNIELATERDKSKHELELARRQKSSEIQKRAEISKKLQEKRRQYLQAQGDLKKTLQKISALQRQVQTTTEMKKQQNKDIARLREKTRRMETAISTFAFRLAQQDIRLKKANKNTTGNKKHLMKGGGEPKPMVIPLKQRLTKPKKEAPKLKETIKSKVRVVSCKGKPGTPGWWVHHGDTVHITLNRWSKRVGWVLVWKSNYRRVMVADACFNGDFKTAVKGLIQTIGNSKNPVRGEFYQNNVLRITDLEDAGQ